MPASKRSPLERWVRRRVSQANSRCRFLGLHGQELDPLAVLVAANRTWPNCHWCRDKIRGPRYLSLDHLEPLASGGRNELENLVYACRACNLLRSDWNAADWKRFVALLQAAGLWAAFKQRFRPRRFRR